MRLMIIKRLLIWLSVAALVGAPWAQAFAQGASHPCTMSLTAASAAMTASDAAACNSMAAHQMDPGKGTSATCTQNCVAPLNVAVPMLALHFEQVMPAFEIAIPVGIDGRIPKPELSPPIALI